MTIVSEAVIVREVDITKLNPLSYLYICCGNIPNHVEMIINDS